MKIKIFGFEHPISVLSDVKKEFERLGHILVDSGPVDMIFHMTGFFDDALEYYFKESPKAIKIFNLLDANPFDPNWPVNKAFSQLNVAEIRTTISNTTKKQIYQRTGISDINVIGYPILPKISNLNYVKTIEFLWVGRISGTKRFNLVLQTLDKMGVDLNLLVVAGPERPPYGTWVGVLDQTTLNELYNSSRFVFLTSISEGLGLSAIEACCVGSFPIVCNDNPVIEELGLMDFAADPDPTYLAIKINTIFTQRDNYLKISNSLGEKFRTKFSVETFVQNVINLYDNHIYK